MRTSRALIAVATVMTLLAGVVLTACGSQGDDQQQSATSYEAGSTETTERPDRQSSVAAQQAEAEPDDEGAVVEVLRRHRAGLVAERNVVGDPDAPITIVEYSDFQ